MKFKLIVSTGLAMAVSVILAMSVIASGALPGSGWWTQETVQNVDPANASGAVSVVAYDASSASTFSTIGSSLDGGWARTFSPSDFTGMSAGFSGSGVVQSSVPAVALVTITNQPVGGGLGVAGGRARERFQGMISPGSPLYFPLAKHAWYGYTDIFYIQNAGGVAATAQAVFTAFSGLTYTYTTPLIGPNQMVVISPLDAGMPNCCGVGKGPHNLTWENLGAMTISSSQPMAGTYIEYVVAETTATVINSTRGFASTDLDTSAFAPVVKRNWYGRYTGISVLNIETSSITATVTFTGTVVAGVNNPCAGKGYVESQGIAAGKAGVFVQKAGSTLIPEGCLASATISANGRIVVLVNEEQVAGATRRAGIAYFASPANSTTTKLAAPYYTDRRGGFYSGLQIENVGSVSATNVVATFYCYGGSNGTTQFTAISTPRTIDSGGSFNFVRPNTMPAGTFTPANPFASQNALCSVIVTSDQPIVANINEDNSAVVNDANYEGFNLAP